MVGSIIDADKLQNEKFVKKDWIVYANGEKSTVIFNKTREEINRQISALQGLSRVKFILKPCIISIQEMEE